MSKKINLLSLVDANQNLTEDGFSGFLSYYDVVLKAEEINDLSTLVSSLINQTEINASDLENFFISYKIPQIGKEFDLLRFGQNYHINIELKSTSTQEKMLTQLKRNKYYLKFLGKPTCYLTFESHSNTLYYLTNDEILEKIDFHVLSRWIKEQEIENLDNANVLFNPSDYLVSPFNSTEQFIRGEYFLTNQQEELNKRILSSIHAPTLANFISLTGGAGTGKTLLAYDIVKNILHGGQQALILHCGQLNHGHLKLIEQGWVIASIKSLQQYDLSKFYLILIDESQRLRQWQFEIIHNNIKQNNGNCIFAYDKLQTLGYDEERVNTSSQIAEICGENTHRLSEKIRSNKEISNFITALLNNKRNFDFNSENIQIRYFNTPEDVRLFLSSLNSEEWEVLRFTPSQYNNEFHESYSQIGQVSHAIIGQEFEGIALVIDKFFTYNSEGKLIYKSRSHYLAPKMLFQNLTRARKRLLVIILQNEELLTRCISIT